MTGLQKLLNVVDALPEARRALNGVEADRVAYVTALDEALTAAGWTDEAYIQALCELVENERIERIERAEAQSIAHAEGS